MMAPIVTAHAMVRYLERKHGRMVKRLCRTVRKSGDVAVLRELAANHGLDRAALQAEMLAPPVCEAMAAGARAVKHGGVWFVFENSRIVTVTPTGTPPARRA